MMVPNMYLHANLPVVPHLHVKLHVHVVLGVQGHTVLHAHVHAALHVHAMQAANSCCEASARGSHTWHWCATYKATSEKKWLAG